MIDGHGDDLFRYGDKIKVNFSTNIPQSVNHSGLMEYIFKKGDIFRNYPEPEPRSVELRLAEVHSVDANNIIVTNGATEVIYLLAHAFAEGKSAVVAPTFREYQDACGVYRHSISFISSLDEIGEDMDMVWLCNPNNPTGSVYDRNSLLDAIDRHRHTVFVVDQAYASYSVKATLSVEDIMERGNAVMLHSLTKQFVVPGLRIGYAIGPKNILDRLRSLRMPWSVNSIAIEAALYLLDNASDYIFNRDNLHNEAIFLAKNMRKMGIGVNDTDCNFILAQLPQGATAAQLKSWLIDNHGLLIRDASNFEGLTSAHFRVAAQNHDENILLINALKQWISVYQSHRFL